METRKTTGYFTKAEAALWALSVTAIIASFLLFRSESYLTLLASLIGVTSLIYNAKGNPFGQLLMVVFSLLYGVLSYRARYYGEMLTYLGMTMPMAVFALISWLKHPYDGNRAEVRVNRIGRRESICAAVLSLAVTDGFYFVLKAFHTANLLPSTISVATSFLAVYLTFCRSAAYAIAYAANDVVLIVLWLLAARSDPSALSVVVCFSIFLLNDIYGFLSWRTMAQRQTA